jgi:hypothetical protein
MIEAVVSSQHHGDVDVGLVLQSKRVIDGRMCDLIAAFRQTVA